MSGGIQMKPLNITLSLWPHQEVEKLDKSLPWSPVKENEFCINGKIYDATLAKVCLVASSLNYPYTCPKKNDLFSSQHTEGEGGQGFPPPCIQHSWLEQFKHTRLVEHEHLMDHEYI